jgi:hypothetical protein
MSQADTFRLAGAFGPSQGGATGVDSAAIVANGGGAGRWYRIACLLLPILVLAAAGVAIRFDHHLSREVWRRDLVRQSVQLAERVRLPLAMADAVRRSLASEIQAMDLDDDTLAEVLGNRGTFDLLRARIGGMAGIADVRIVAADGDVVNDTHAFPPPAQASGQRDRYRALMADPDPAPVLDDLGRDGPGLALAAKIVSGGTPIGLVLVEVEDAGMRGPLVEAASELNGDAILGRDDGVPLFATAGAAAAPVRAAFQSVHPGSPVLVQDQGGKAGGATMSATAAVAGSPLAVALVVSDQVVFAAWRRRAIGLATGAIGVSLLLAGLFLWMARLADQRDLARAEARQAAASAGDQVVLMDQAVRRPLQDMLEGLNALADSILPAAQRRLIEDLHRICDGVVTTVASAIDRGHGDPGGSLAEQARGTWSAASVVLAVAGADDHEVLLREVSRIGATAMTVDGLAEVPPALRAALAAGQRIGAAIVDGDRSDGLAAADLAAILDADPQLSGVRLLVVGGAASDQAQPGLCRPLTGDALMAALAAPGVQESPSGRIGSGG